MRRIGRSWKQLRACLILGVLIIGFGQACGQMGSLPQDDGSGNSSSTGTNNGNGSGTGGSGSTLPPGPTPPPIFQNPGNTGGNSTTNFGYLEYISPAGEVIGEAKNPSNLSESITVYFFVDGPQGSGASGGQAVANLPSQINNGNTRFNYRLPANLRNGEPHTLYVYAFVDNSYVQLANSPMTYAAYTPTAAGQQYYETTLKPLLQAKCSACHQINYQFHYSKLINPTKFQGATATDNDLINKPSGQVVHGGGMRCAGGRDASPCLEIQQWWRLEFGN